MNRREFILKAAGASLAARAKLGKARQTGGQAEGRKPNIILILADDLGYGDLGCYGQKRIRTTNLDRMAAEGVRFTDDYAGSTVCAPSRCALMTGLHMGHELIQGNARVPLRPEDVTVARLLREAGYATGIIGKWGLGEAGSSGIPTRQGFDYWCGYLNQHHAHNYWPTYLWRNEEKVLLNNVVPKEDAQGGGVASERREYSHDLFAQEALAREMELRAIPFERQKRIAVDYKGRTVGTHQLDLVADGRGIAELNAPTALADTHKHQLLSYLKTTRLKLGILLNS